MPASMVTLQPQLSSLCETEHGATVESEDSRRFGQADQSHVHVRLHCIDNGEIVGYAHKVNTGATLCILAVVIPSANT